MLVSHCWKAEIGYSRGVPSWKGVAWVLACVCDDEDWYPKMVPVLLDLVPASFFWKEASQVRSASGRPAKLTAAAFKKAVTATQRSWQLVSSAARDPDLEFDCHRLGSQISFKLTLHDAAWQRAGAGLASAIEQLSLGFLRALRGQAIFAPDSGIYPSFYPKLSYPHVEDAEDVPLFRYDLVMDVLDRRMVKRLTVVDQPEAAGRMKRICAAALPRGVRRVDDGEQTLLFWTDDLQDEDALGKAAAGHERWLDKAIRGKA